MKQLLKKDFFLLLFFFIFTYLVPLNNRLLWQPDETRYAEISREMLLRNDWIVPYLLNIRYFEKPSPGYWINNISQIIFGNTNFAVRFGVVFSTMISSILVYWLAIIMWHSKNIAFIAALMYISMLLVFTIGTYSVLDPMLSMWLIACILCYFWFIKKATTLITKLLAWVIMGVTCGIAFMTKGFLALVIPIIVIFPITFYQKRFIEILKFSSIAVFSSMLVSLPWVFTINKYEPDFWNYFFWVEHIQRFLSQNAQHKSPLWFYIPIILFSVIPWLGFLPGSLFNSWQKRKDNPEMFFLFWWFFSIFLFFSIAKGKLVTYILPTMAPFALMMAKYAVDCIKNRNLFSFKFNGFTNIIFSITAIFILISIGLCIKYPIYTSKEWPKLILGILVFSIWFIISYFSMIYNPTYWLWNAVCSIPLSLSIGYILPQSVIDSKLPQQIIRQNISLLQKSKFVLTNNVGIGAGLAWELNRNDIYLYEKSGELNYGLSYPDAQFRLIRPDNFIGWLNQARKNGLISIVLVLCKNTDLLNNIPKPYCIVRNTRVAIISYY